MQVCYVAGIVSPVTHFIDCDVDIFGMAMNRPVLKNNIST